MIENFSIYRIFFDSIKLEQMNSVVCQIRNPQSDIHNPKLSQMIKPLCLNIHQHPVSTYQAAAGIQVGDVTDH